MYIHVIYEDKILGKKLKRKEEKGKGGQEMNNSLLLQITIRIYHLSDMLLLVIVEGSMCHKHRIE